MVRAFNDQHFEAASIVADDFHDRDGVRYLGQVCRYV